MRNINTRGSAGMIGLLVVVALIGLGFVYFQGKSSSAVGKTVGFSDTGELSGAMKAAEGVANAANEMAAKTDAMMKEDVMMQKDDTMMEKKPESAMMEKGSYEVYAADKLVKANSGDVVLFFRATWCPTCKAVDADIRSHLGAIPSGLTILDVNYDDSSALKQKYGVTYQHTFVQVKADGTLIKKWSGSPTLAALVAEVQ